MSENTKKIIRSEIHKKRIRITKLNDRKIQIWEGEGVWKGGTQKNLGSHCAWHPLCPERHGKSSTEAALHIHHAVVEGLQPRRGGEPGATMHACMVGRGGGRGGGGAERGGAG